MKGKRIRYQQTGEFHSLTFSCFRCRGYFSTDGARDLFEDALERVRQRYLFVVGGYVVMPEHLHLLVNEPKSALLSKAIQALTMRSRERPFWQAHYHDFNVSTHTKFVEKLRYIHRNPRGPRRTNSVRWGGSQFVEGSWRSRKIGSGPALGTIKLAYQGP